MNTKHMASTLELYGQNFYAHVGAGRLLHIAKTTGKGTTYTRCGKATDRGATIKPIEARRAETNYICTRCYGIHFDEAAR